MPTPPPMPSKQGPTSSAALPKARPTLRWSMPSQQNLVTEAEIDTALKRLFTARFGLGMFDPPAAYAYGHIPFSRTIQRRTRKLSLQAARESMVLLKNENSFLPLKSNIRTIAVVGPTAELVQSLQGNYNGPPPLPVYPIDGIEQRFKSRRTSFTLRASTLVEGFPMPIERTALKPASGEGPGLTGRILRQPQL